MKKLTKLTSAISIASAIALTTAHGQITVDEFGKGFYGGAALPSGFTTDPISGLPGFAYTLPFPYTFTAASGDIWLIEPSSTGNQSPSDLLRFTRDPQDPTGQRSLLFFYSDASPTDPPDAPADLYPLPPSTPFMVFTETGLFGSPYSEAGPNGYVYTALPGMPGWDGVTAAGTVYTFISDVPEPGALSLLFGGLGLLWGYKLLRRKALA